MIRLEQLRADHCFDGMLRFGTCRLPLQLWDVHGCYAMELGCWCCCSVGVAVRIHCSVRLGAGVLAPPQGAAVAHKYHLPSGVYAGASFDTIDTSYWKCVDILFAAAKKEFPATLNLRLHNTFPTIDRGGGNHPILVVGGCRFVSSVFGVC